VLSGADSRSCSRAHTRRRHAWADRSASTGATPTATIEFTGFADTDVVIEAVFEDLDVKHRMVRDFEKACSPEAIFASNTSSIPIAKIAARRAPGAAWVLLADPMDGGMIDGMTTSKIAVSLPGDLVTQARRAVKRGRAASVSAQQA